MSKRERNMRIVAAIIIYVILLLILRVAFKPLFMAFLPFIIAFILAKIIDPVVRFLHHRLKAPRPIASLLMVIVAVLLLGLGIAEIISKLWTEISSLIDRRNEIVTFFVKLFTDLDAYCADKFGSDYLIFLSQNINGEVVGQKVSAYITDMIKPILQGAVNFAKSMPSILFFTVVVIMGTYFISSDEKFFDKILNLFPNKIRKYMSGFKGDMGHALSGVLKAEITMIFITFMELLIGFLIIGGETGRYAFLLALCICVVDALPVFGTGTILIPWSIVSFFMGNTKMGISLIILYLVCLIMRQILEPRLVGDRIGLHPLVTLASMYVGLRFFSILGMLGGPVVVFVCISLNRVGVFTDLWSYITTGSVREREDT